MIGRLTGKVVECRPGRMLLDVQGVGYAVQIPLSTFYSVSGNDGDVATLHVHTHVREDALELFGFATTDERGSFELLIGISGVGPRLALAILSGIGVGELQSAIAQGDRARLQRIPGVGRKTAERVLLELRDKLTGRGKRDEADSKLRTGGAGEEIDGPWADAVSALVNLGYTRDRAAHAVDAAQDDFGETVSLEALLKAALGRLVR